MAYVPREWIDRLVEFPDRFEIEDVGNGYVKITPASGEVLQEGTAVLAEYLNHMEAGIYDAYGLVAVAGGVGSDIGIIVSDIMGELEKIHKQRIVSGQGTITDSNNSAYFRGEDPYVNISLPDYAFSQLNAPDYNVLVTVLDADDYGKVGELIPYDKAQNGFKVRMTGSAEEVTFKWTILNPRVA